MLFFQIFGLAQPTYWNIDVKYISEVIIYQENRLLYPNSKMLDIEAYEG